MAAATPAAKPRPADEPGHARDEKTLTVLTLNAAHGRKDGRNQLLQSSSALRQNLQLLASLVKVHAPDVVALQEADGPSRWSGRFDHVGTVAADAGFPWQFRGDHAEGWLYRYGTALLSRLPLHDAASFRFDPTPPTPRKGFVIAELNWPEGRGGRPGPRIDVVSVHLDYLSSAARQHQYEQLAAALETRDRPAIVLGDFNSEWATSDSPVRRLAERLQLDTHEPGSDATATHAGRRIDWILISKDFRFNRYEVLPDIVSDHQAVVAEIGLRQPPG